MNQRLFRAPKLTRFNKRTKYLMTRQCHKHINFFFKSHPSIIVLITPYNNQTKISADNFFMLALLVEYIFLTFFYGLYFNHQFFTHYIIQIFKFLQFLADLCGQLSCTASNTCPLTCLWVLLQAVFLGLFL